MRPSKNELRNTSSDRVGGIPKWLPEVWVLDAGSGVAVGDADGAGEVFLWGLLWLEMGLPRE